MIRTVIVDDEPIARRGLAKLLAQDPDINVVAECGTGVDAVDAIESHRADLVFLDIKMPGMDGFDVVEAIPTELMPVVVFVTAFDDFALRAFDAHALDYVLKPIDPERFETALRRAKTSVVERTAGDLPARLHRMLSELDPDTRKDRVVVKDGGRIFFVDLDEISWIESAGNYVKLHTDERTHLLRETMWHMEQRLSNSEFVRISRSKLVNADRIRELRSTSGGRYDVILEKGMTLTSSRNYRTNLDRLLKTQNDV